MKKVWQFGMSTVMTALLLAGCGNGTATEEPTENAAEQTETEAPAAAPEAEFPVTLTDAAGEEVTIEEEPDAIVSMVPSNTEIAYELGLGEKMVGLSDFDNYPAETADVEKIGGMEFNVEKIISLQPDLVLAHESGLGTGEAGFQQLRDAGIQVYVVQSAEDFEQVYETMETIGQLTGAQEEAEAAVTDMQEEVAAIEEQAATIEEPKSVFIEVSGAPEIYTAGSGTFMDVMLEKINAENAAAGVEGWVPMDPEAIVELNPDVILTTYGYYVPDAVEQVLARDGFADVTAIKEEAVYDVDSDMTSRPGPRLDDGLLEMAKAVYPEVFSE